MVWKKIKFDFYPKKDIILTMRNTVENKNITVSPWMAGAVTPGTHSVCVHSPRAISFFGGIMQNLAGLKFGMLKVINFSHKEKNGLPDPKYCEHEWVSVESQCERDVRCSLCGIPGERDEKTNVVYFPAT